MGLLHNRHKTEVKAAGPCLLGGGGADRKLQGPLRGTRPFGTPSGAPGTASLGIPTELRPGNPLGIPGQGHALGGPRV